MTRPDEVAIILSHANNEEKLSVLKDCINSVKKLNYKIIISSHLPIPNDIIHLVDYIIYDKDNHLINRHNTHTGNARTWSWISYPGFYQELDINNHAFAVLRLMINGSYIAKANGFNIIHMIHYDCIIQDQNLLDKHYTSLLDNELYYYQYPEFPDRVDANLFSVRTDRFISIFNHFKTKEDYSNQFIGIFERFLHQLFYSNSIKAISEDINILKQTNIIDKINSTINLGKSKEYHDRTSQTIIYLSKDNNNNYYVVITTNDGFVNEIIIQQNKFTIKPHIANLIKINSDIITNIHCYVPYLDWNYIIDNNTTVANCSISDFNLINLQNL